MKKKPSKFKSFILSFFLIAISVYAIYINPYTTGNELQTKILKEVPIELEVPDRYQANLMVLTTNLEVQGTKEMIKELEEEKIHIKASILEEIENIEVEGTEDEEGIKEVTVPIIVNGLENYIYQIQDTEVTVEYSEIEPEEIQPKVVFKGTPGVTVTGVDVLEPILGYFKQEEQEILEVVNVTIDGEKINKTGELEVEGEIEILDVENNVMNSDLLDKTKVKVRVYTE